MKAKLTIDELIANSSIGRGLADIKKRGIDAHLADLEREMAPAIRSRDSLGRYQARLDRMCVCGHALGRHTAARCIIDGEPRQECLEDRCECACFTRRKGYR